MEGSREAGGNEGDARAPHDPREVASVFLIDSMQRRWLPSLMQESNDWDNDVPRAASARNTSQGYTSPIDPRYSHATLRSSSEQSPTRSRSPDTFITIETSVENILSRSPEKSNKWKYSLHSRWRPYASGVVQRYNVSPRVYSHTDNVQKSQFNSLEDMAKRLENDRKNHRPPRQTPFHRMPSLKPQVVCMTEEDPRLIRREPTPEREEDVHLPPRVVEKKALFNSTVGSVRPYVLGQHLSEKERRRRPGKKMPSMPASALNQDPVAVFVEAMRHQRPSLGIFSFHVQ
ncbi:hypothetical protein ERJ75_001589100 [Trypanosoma vivax]|uniref:Uncharacterized protein n=1 Tax=Trypanosoma vivax (strain Y486) TaxID=1055687 RepID=G0TS93_TRYVY|nr:hypothetical protein ERJ75_001589100 [Trypanosoma vivax]CCC46819.1 conserved hypothetical protein [Trypanosoma vivax Y486]